MTFLSFSIAHQKLLRSFQFLFSSLKAIDSIVFQRNLEEGFRSLENKTKRGWCWTEKGRVCNQGENKTCLLK